MAEFRGCRGIEQGKTWSLIDSLQLKFQWFDRLLGRSSSGIGRCLSGSGPLGGVHCGVYFLREVFVDLGG